MEKDVQILEKDIFAKNVKDNQKNFFWLSKNLIIFLKINISEKVPFLALYDLVGNEIGSNHTFEDIQNVTLEEIIKYLNIIFPNKIGMYIEQPQIEFLKMIRDLF